MGIYSVGIK